MKSFCVIRHFRNAVYRIMVDNKAGAEKGVKSITLDGNPLEGTVLPVLNDGKVHEVVVVMEKK
jgi:cellobiose phosphorylase